MATQHLHAMGIESVMMTGDARAVAEAAGRDLGIDTVLAGVLPNEKAASRAVVGERRGSPWGVRRESDSRERRESAGRSLVRRLSRAGAAVCRRS